MSSCRRTWSERRAWRASLLAIGLGAMPSAAGAAERPTSVVSMGDSYISGEAGRWLGNSANVVADRDGTDRACVFAADLCATYDRWRVYLDGTAADGCHRSDVAEVHSARLPVDRSINLACSGAVTTDLLRSSSGATRPHGESPQADRLLAAAESTRIRMIVVSVGGNDLGFAPIVTACVEAYLTRGVPCSKTRAEALADAKLAYATARIARAIDEIRATMRTAGYARGSYRLVLQTYPVVLPHAADARYSQADPRRALDGCPFYDADMDWTNDVAAPRIGRAIKAAAAVRKVDVLELLRAFEGHEVCARTAVASSPTRRPSPAGAEWGRAVSASTIAQGDRQELFHPNAYGHSALGRCVSALYSARRGSYACSGAAGLGPEQLSLTRLRSPWTGCPGICSVPATWPSRAKASGG